MSDFAPTDEQLAIVAAATSTSDNLLISALAGAFKTSTLVLIARALPSTPMLCLAFNKRIVEEMTERLPGNCECKSLNSLGHGVWLNMIGKRARVDTRKNYTILTELTKALPKRLQEDAWETFADTLKAIATGKTSGYIPTGSYDQAKPLMGDDEFFETLDEAPTGAQCDLIRAASRISIKQAFEGFIDFDDQILLPTVFPVIFPRYPLVLVDEAQDLSALNHATLRKLARTRLIAVGDECQAIYGFRGAHTDSMRALAATFNMRKLVLSISGRCPQAVVREARWRAPHMQWLPGAREGSVESLAEWDVDALPESAAIVCRNNAPIFAMALKLLRAGRYPEIVGNDIGRTLVRILKKFGPPNMPQSEVLTAIEHWRYVKLTKSRTPDRVNDQAECLTIFAHQGDQLGDAMAYAEHIMAARGPITLMTGHKAKGLEFDNVFILDRQLIRVRDEPQDANLLYVMQTRSKDRLVYVRTEDFMLDGEPATTESKRPASTTPTKPEK